MDRDPYLRVVLTVIAICLVWICIRDVALVPSAEAARDSGVVKVQVVSIHREGWMPWEALPVASK